LSKTCGFLSPFSGAVAAASSNASFSFTSGPFSEVPDAQRIGDILKEFRPLYVGRGLGYMTESVMKFLVGQGRHVDVPGGLESPFRSEVPIQRCEVEAKRQGHTVNFRGSRCGPLTAGETGIEE
jgi:hypothetical protein